MLATTDVEALRRYLQVFARRLWPHFDARMLQFCLHDDAQVRRRAVAAVANNKHPEVRRFALQLLEDPSCQEYATNLLAANYGPGDELRVLEWLVLPDDKCQLHSTLMNLLKLVENDGAVRRGAAELVYEKTPCGLCRVSAVELLISRDGFVGQFGVECRFDVEREIRSLAGGPEWSD